MWKTVFLVIALILGVAAVLLILDVRELVRDGDSVHTKKMDNQFLLLDCKVQNLQYRMQYAYCLNSIKQYSIAIGTIQIETPGLPEPESDQTASTPAPGPGGMTIDPSPGGMAVDPGPGGMIVDPSSGGMNIARAGNVTLDDSDATVKSCAVTNQTFLGHLETCREYWKVCSANRNCVYPTLFVID